MNRPIDPERTLIILQTKELPDGPPIEEFKIEIDGALTKNDVIESLLTPEDDEWPLPYSLRSELVEQNWGAAHSTLTFIVDVLQSPWFTAATGVLVSQGLEYIFRRRKGSLSRLPNSSAESKAKSYVALTRNQSISDLKVTGTSRDRERGLVTVHICGNEWLYKVEVKRYKSDSTYGIFLAEERRR